MPAGMIKVVTSGRGRILGAAIVGHDAGEMIALWSLAIAQRLLDRAMLASCRPIRAAPRSRDASPRPSTARPRPPPGNGA